jgi:cyanate permease
MAYLLIVSQRTAPGIITDQLLAEFQLSGSALGWSGAMGSLGSMLTFASVRETFPPTQVGVLSVLANTGGFLSAVLLPPLMGNVLDVLGMHEASSYQAAFLIPCLFAALGVLGACWLPRSDR